jgi:hypothetical protein
MNFGINLENVSCNKNFKMINPNFLKQEKRKNLFLILLWNTLLLLLILLIQGNAFGQYQKPPSRLSKFLKNWSINVNAGQTSFFGEVSLYDDELTEKLSHEGSWSYGFVLSRQLTPVFGLSGQLIMGHLRGANTRSHFEAEIKEYTLNTTLNFVNLLMPDNDAKFFLYGKIGAGQFEFKSKLVFDDPEKKDKYVESESPEFLYLIGGGAYYKLNHSFEVNAEGTARLVNNDKLDGTTNKNDDDYYSFISVGVTYKINNKPRDTRYYKKLGMKSPLIRRR